MRSSLSGPATTLLMLIPLVVVPLLAVFGVPDLSQDRAASDKEGDAVSVSLGEAAVDGELSSEMFVPIRDPDSQPDVQRARPQQTNQDPFAVFGDPASDSASAQATVDSIGDDRSQAGNQGSPADDAEARPAHPRPLAVRSASTADGGPSLQSPFTQIQDSSGAESNAPDATSATVTLESAVQRLRELGIQNYELGPGEAAEAFHFSCFLTSAENPRIVRRFEAEAGEPLQAVADVLGQVEHWARAGR